MKAQEASAMRREPGRVGPLTQRRPREDQPGGHAGTGGATVSSPAEASGSLVVMVSTAARRAVLTGQFLFGVGWYF